jgi:hypothetical protein
VTVRDMVNAAKVEIRKGDLHPERVRELQFMLAALLGNILDEITEADMAYNDVLLKHLESEEKANRARIRAENTEAYRRKRVARDTRELADELIAALKYASRSLTEEFKRTA